MFLKKKMRVQTEQLWDIFTVKEEYNTSIKDNYNRNLYWMSNNRNVLKPTVSEYLIEHGLTPEYPNGKNFALCLTHDVDRLFDTTPKRQLLKQLMKQILLFKLGKAVKVLKKILSKNNEINDFKISETLKFSEKYGAKSSFYFLALNPNEQDFNYHLENIQHIFSEIKQHNGEIGLHGSHTAYNNLEKLQAEKQKLEKAAETKILGHRNHYLKFETPTSWHNLANQNFTYDTTFGYADCAGFRNGMCHPYTPFSLKTNSYLDIVELPLIIMDCTLWKYMHLGKTEQLAVCKQIIDEVAKNKGVLTLLWHNTEMQGHKGYLYEEILKYAQSKNAWMPTAIELVNYWKEKKYHIQTQELLSQIKPTEKNVY